METPGCLNNPHIWTMAEVISPSHETGKHLCVQEQRKKWGHFTGKLEKRLRQKWEFYRRGCRGTKDLRDKTIFCSTAPINSDIYKLFVVYVSRSRVTRGARITEKTLKTYIQKRTALHYIHCEWMDELQRLMTIWLNLLRGTISSPLSSNLSDYKSTWYDRINSILRCINDIISDYRIIGQFQPGSIIRQNILVGQICSKCTVGNNDKTTANSNHVLHYHHHVIILFTSAFILFGSTSNMIEKNMLKKWTQSYVLFISMFMHMYVKLN